MKTIIKRFTKTIRMVLCALLRLPLILLISIISIPAHTCCMALGIGAMVKIWIESIAILDGSFLSILGCIGAILLGLLLCCMAFSCIFSNSDDRDKVLYLWLSVVPEWAEAYDEALRRERASRWDGWTDDV